MKKEIKIKSTKDIQKISQIVSKYDYSIWIHGESGMADAKSVLGMCLLSLNEKLYIVIDDEINTNELFSELKEFMTIEN